MYILKVLTAVENVMKVPYVGLNVIARYFIAVPPASEATYLG
jgi:hypothetical protein